MTDSGRLLGSASCGIIMLPYRWNHVHLGNSRLLVQARAQEHWLVDRLLGNCRICRLLVGFHGYASQDETLLTRYRLSAAFGCASDSSTKAEYQSSLSSMWGSAAYLLSSLHQWYAIRLQCDALPDLKPAADVSSRYESVNKGPVMAFPNTQAR